MEEKIRVLISEEDVNKKISEVASRISRDYEGQQVHLICIPERRRFFLPASWPKGLRFPCHWILCPFPATGQVQSPAVW